MSDYRRVMGPSSSVFDAPAFHQMQDELEVEQQRAKHSRLTYYEEEDSVDETDMSEGPTEYIQKAKDREACGTYGSWKIHTRRLAHLNQVLLFGPSTVV